MSLSAEQNGRLSHEQVADPDRPREAQPNLEPNRREASASAVQPVSPRDAADQSPERLRSLAELRAHRGELAERAAMLTLDLGGLAYEMAVRDHYRLDLLARRAAELQRVDGELAEVERMLAAADAGIQGHCRACGALHSRGAIYCWQCGTSLRPEGRPALDSAGNQQGDVEGS